MRFLSRIKHLLDGSLEDLLRTHTPGLHGTLLPVELQNKFVLAKEELQRTLAEMMHISRAYNPGEATKAVRRIQETLEKL